MKLHTYGLLRDSFRLALKIESVRTIDMVGATAWNNRLSSLAALGLIIEMSLGRTKRYKPLLQGL